MASFEGLDATKWPEIEPHYQQFLDRQIDSAESLESWLLELGRFSAYVGETGAMLYVNMTCDTENEEIKQAYLDFVENVEPELAKVGDLLNRKLVESPYAEQLDSEEYNVLLRDSKMDLALFTMKMDSKNTKEFLSKQVKEQFNVMVKESNTTLTEKRDLKEIIYIQSYLYFDRCIFMGGRGSCIDRTKHQRYLVLRAS